MEQEPQLQGERLSFGIRTVISVVVQVVVIAFFLSKLDNKITRLDEIMADLKSDQKAASTDAVMQRAKFEAELALINVRLAVLENQLHINPATGVQNPKP